MYFGGQSDGSKTADQIIPKATFIKALGMLNDKLAEADKHVTFLCVGGATMMLVHGTREGTQDIDGILQPSDPETTKIFRRLAFEVSQELNIDENWINTQVKDIMAGQTYKRTNFEALPEYGWSNLTLLFAKPGYLLSMKCQSMRQGKRDFADIVNLLKALGIRNLEDLHTELDKWGGAWDFIGNDEYTLLKLAIAWAFPGQTEYDQIRLNALEKRKQVQR
jgi:hypothetical protein